MFFLGNNMKDAIVLALEGIPHEVAVALLGMIPITELQLAIPVGILRYGFSPPLAFLLALLGNLVPFFPLYYGLEKLRVLLSKTAPWSVRFLDRFVARAERKAGDAVWHNRKPFFFF